jgi:ethanolamine permease
VPAIALVIALVFLVALTISNISTVSWVVVAYALAIIYYFVYSKMQSTSTEEFNKEVEVEVM